MTLEASNIVLTLSGGSTNNSPAASLGGNPSGHPLVGVLNNLFDDITLIEAGTGQTDYRCFYIFNNSLSDSLYSTQVYIASQVPLGANVQLGVTIQSDIQRIKITGSPTGGYFVLNYITVGGTYPVTVYYNVVLSNWALALQNALNSLSVLSGVFVSASTGSGTINFDITFGGADDNRFHDLFELSSNALTGSPLITISKVQDGSPMNAIAPGLTSSLSQPPNVDFEVFNSVNPIMIGDLHPGDGCPIWVQRIISPNSVALLNDGFALTIIGNPIPTEGTIPVCSVIGNFTWNTGPVKEYLTDHISTTYLRASPISTLDLTQLQDNDSIVFYGTSDDVTIMVGGSSTVSESFGSLTGPVLFSIPTNYIIFRDTQGNMISNGLSSQKTFLISSGPQYTYPAGNPENTSIINPTGHVIDMEASGISTRKWTTGITKLELYNRGWLTGNILTFRMYYVVSGAGFATVTGVTCADGN